MKYIVEADDHVQMISLTAVQDGTAIMITRNIEAFQTANKTLEEAYQKGYDEAKLIYQNPNAESDYQRGLDDARETITKIAKMPDGERCKIFGDTWVSNILNKYSISEIITILGKHESEQDEIKVGDEVQLCDDPNVCFVVLSIDILNEEISGFDRNGNTYFCRPKDDWRKTGRHFDIESILEAMEE